MDVFLNHMKSVHCDFSVRDVNLQEYFKLHFKYDWSTELLYARQLDLQGPSLCKTILRLNSTQTNQDCRRQQLFVVICRFVPISGQTMFLIKCVRLTDQSWGNISMSLSLTGGEKVGPPGLPLVPELSWSVQPQGIRELKDVWMGAKRDDLSSYHMIPLVFLKNYITEEGDSDRVCF